MKLFQKKVPILYLQKGSKIPFLESEVDVILSPSFYYIKRVNLPVRFSFEIKKYIKSIFEDIIEDDKGYSYTYEKNGDEYIVIAYNDAYISKELNSLPIKIRGLYLAQNEFRDMQKPIKIDDSSALILTKDIVLDVDSSHITDSFRMDVYIDSLILSKHKISIKRGLESVVSVKKIYLASILILFVSFGYIYEYYENLKHLQGFKEDIQRIKEEYKLPSTSVQLSSITKSLTKNVKEQIDLRKDYRHITSIDLKSGEWIQNIEISPKDLFVKIQSTQNRKIDFDIYFKKVFNIKSSKFKNGYYEAVLFK